MAQEHNPVEQAVTRALRENLERLQRTADELHQAINDVVAACSSSKPTHALPPMLRAQTAAAALTASLEVLSRFVATALQPASRSPLEAELSRLASAVQEAPAPAPAPPAAPPAPKIAPPPVSTGAEQESQPVPPVTEPQAAEPAPAAPERREASIESEDGFDINRLSTEEQELHRRANRVAKVSMQDIKMLRPDQVRLGREHKDICVRLRDDIDKAHKDYDRRFRPIMAHPVDYFYHWMVEVLGAGDPEALGEYPYSSPALQR